MDTLWSILSVFWSIIIVIGILGVIYSAYSIQTRAAALKSSEPVNARLFRALLWVLVIGGVLLHHAGRTEIDDLKKRVRDLENRTSRLR